MKKFKLVLLLIIVSFLLIGFLWWSWANQPASQLASAPLQTFVVPKGQSLTSVAERLEEEGLIRNSFAFKVLILTEGLSGSIQAGDFRIRSSLTLREVAYVLTHGNLDIWLTFPEGWRREEFGQRLTANLEEFDYQEFLDLTGNSEGYLFPDTYLIPQEASPAAVIKIFQTNFEKKFSADLKKAAGKAGLTEQQVLILASIVEREVGRDEDRSLVAGILLKRWQQGWPLQTDAAIQYARGTPGDWWPQVTRDDLQVNSPYNTYQYAGLPPTPICNPGLSSIESVVYPQASDYWFYLSDSSGVTHYARTTEEHNQNINRYLR